MLFIFSTPVWIRHLWQLKIVVLLHWCKICTVLLWKPRYNTWKHYISTFEIERRKYICTQYFTYFKYCVCIYIDIYIYNIYAHTNIHTHKYMHTPNIYDHPQTQRHTHTNTPTHPHTHTHPHTTGPPPHTHTHTHTHIYIYKHTYTVCISIFNKIWWKLHNPEVIETCIYYLISSSLLAKIKNTFYIQIKTL